jgi:hypothetical protein
MEHTGRHTTRGEIALKIGKRSRSAESQEELYIAKDCNIIKGIIVG